jgi:hypothetical protein
MRKWGIRLWALLKIAYYSLCFVVGVAVTVVAAAVFVVSLGRLFLPRVR